MLSRALVFHVLTGLQSLRRLRGSALNVLLSFVALLVPAQSLAEYAAIVDAPKTQDHPAVASRTNTPDYLLVYEDDSDGKSRKLRSILFSSYKNQFTPKPPSPQPVGSAPPSAEQLAPDVAYSPTSTRFVVVWQQQKARGSDADIYAQTFYDFAGQPVAGAVKLAGTSDAEAAPSIAYNSANGGFLVVYQKGRPSSSQITEGSNAIWGQLLDDHGQTEGAPFQIATADKEEAGSVANPAVAFGKDRYLVAWERLLEVPVKRELETALVVIAQHDVRANHVLANGTVPDDAFCISCETGAYPRHAGTAQPTDVNDIVNEIQPSVAYNPRSGDWVVVFSKDCEAGSRQRLPPRSDACSPPQEKIVARSVLNTGPGGYQEQVSVYQVSARRRNPDIVYQDRDDTYVVVWEEADWGEYVAFDSATINRMKMNGSDLKPLVNHPFSIPITSKKHITRHPAVAAGKNNLLTVWGGEVWNPSGTKYYWDPAVNQWKVKDEWFGELRWPGPDIYGLLTAY